MRSLKLSLVFVAIIFTFILNGCGGELSQLEIQNQTQRQRINELLDLLTEANLTKDRLERQLQALQQSGSLDNEALQQKVAKYEEDIAKMEEMIKAMQERLLYGGADIPIEVSTKLEDLARSNDMIEYDAERGVVKFKSDLLFEPGSDHVSSTATSAIQTLCGILKSVEAQDFDILIAGHTDDIPIGKPETRAAHPTNWHLSVHRAISVLNAMKANGIESQRMSVRGFGEFRPVEPNGPNNTGNAKNRRVEIFIIPQGA
jgi:chemotaxis protein MotB